MMTKERGAPFSCRTIAHRALGNFPRHVTPRPVLRLSEPGRDYCRTISKLHQHRVYYRTEVFNLNKIMLDQLQQCTVCQSSYLVDIVW